MRKLLELIGTDWNLRKTFTVKVKKSKNNQFFALFLYFLLDKTRKVWYNVII
jgi:hypothetical protein